MTDTPLGTATAPGTTGGPGGTPDEILVAFAEPAAQNRLTVLVRIILAIPHLVVLYALSIAAEVVLIICWFAALFLGRLPEGLADFLSGYLRWVTRVQAYLLLLTDQYPPFALGEVDYPVQILLRPGRLNRLAVLFRIILAIPASLLATLVILGMETIVLFVTWLIVLIMGRMPGALYQAFAAGLRYYLRYSGYLFLLTGTYPWGLFGDQPATVTGWLGGGQPWRLVLSSAAKGLVGMFLAIGVLVFVLYAVLIGVAISANSTVSKAEAGLSVKTAYSSLSTTMAAFGSSVSGCAGKLSCVNRVDARMSGAFGKFGSDLHGIAMPTPASSTASATVQSDANQIATDFQRLSTASSVSQYQHTVASTGLQGLLSQFDADYQSLNQALGVA
ncbi:MAG TPA: DUF4389 domain-containing protein [Streptosporangiaceae bacterium]